MVKKSTLYKREHKADYGKEKIEILYEDSDLVVINKPTGLLSVPYPGSKARTALELLEKIMKGRGKLTSSHRPFVVQRLDRDTSGVMMFVLSESLQKKVMASWQSLVTGRIYRAVAENPARGKELLPDSGTIDLPLAQNSHHMGYVPHDENDKAERVAARTNYTVVLRGKTHTLFELSLDTGKKNQIRAHLSHFSYPLAGDENYRAKTDPFHRLALHARTLEFTHPVTGQLMKFEVEEPAEWADYVKKGDLHPKVPLWLQKEKESLPIEKGQVLSNRKIRGMDFISRGKAIHR